MGFQKANKNGIRKEIAELIDKIKEQSDRIGNQREIPQEELDMILHRIEELHRKTVVWSYLNVLPEETTDHGWDEQRMDPKVEELPAVNAAKEEPVQELLSKEENNDITQETPPVQETVVVEEIKVVIEPLKPEPQIPSKKEYPDIRRFIGFNEKLMYIRQVFAGDSAAYEEVLNQINACETYEEARAFLDVLAGEYRWSKDQEPVQIFQLTVKRRFS